MTIRPSGANEAMYHSREEGPYEVIFTVDNETWSVSGDTVQEVLDEAEALLDEYSLTESDIMAMENDDEVERAARDAEIAQDIYDYVREWADAMAD